jgi:hypothetical protein
MTKKDSSKNESGDAALMALVRVIVARNVHKACRLLAASPGLAAQAIEVGASRSVSQPYFFEEITHYVYAGDTALHVAAAELVERQRRSNRKKSSCSCCSTALAPRTKTPRERPLCRVP